MRRFKRRRVRQGILLWPSVMSRTSPRNPARGSAVRPVIFFTDRGDASFIRSDIGILSSFADVRRFSFRASRWSLIPTLFRSLWVSIRRVRGADLVVCQFAGWNAWLPLLVARAFGKPAALVVHGTDCVSFPSIDYGNFRKWPLKAITATCLRRASVVVPVHESLVHSTTSYATGQPLEQGIMAHCPRLSVPIKVMHHGFDPDQWQMDASVPRSGLLTVAAGLRSERTRTLKGIDLVIACARKSPDLTFSVVGLDRSWILDPPPNIEAIPFVSQDVLQRIYQRSRFYLQLSISEGFGCALAEAMLCGCVPIVSDTGSLPAIVGGTGHVLRRRDPEALLELLQSVSAGEAAGGSSEARNRICENFPLSRRMQGWRTLVTEMLPDAGDHAITTAAMS